ncbi:MAG: hypothetical protein GY703_11585 [Gammaproteobacteria bacterium]|nr:hypothetical protein [Gammaproteobacteria bacterium]
MRVLLIPALLLWVGQPMAVYADDTAASEFQNQARSLGSAINSDNSKASGRCQQLARNVEDTRGWPQRHSTAIQAYNLECRRLEPSNNDRPPGDGPGLYSGYGD